MSHERLPKGIYKVGARYDVRLQYDGKLFRASEQSLENAVNILTDFRSEIKNRKAQKEINNHENITKINTDDTPDEYILYGILYDKKYKLWKSEIKKDKVLYKLGSFQSQYEAAKAYNMKAIELYGDQAKLNILTKIPLRNTEKNIVDYAQIDEDEFNKVSRYNWSKVGNYAIGTVSGKRILMHQFIMGKAPKGQVIDHKDKDGLNNTKSNLRFATFSENSQNRDKKDGSTSNYIGVIWHTSHKKWVAWSSTTYLGCFDDEEEAARKYDTYTFIKHGPDSATNNLVNYEDIKDIDIESLLCKRNRDLPKYIYPKRDKFEIKIKYNKQEYRAFADTLNSAILKLKELQLDIEELKKVDEELHQAKEITRNEKDIAIIPIYDDVGNITDHAMVSDDKWHECMKFRWSKNSNGYAQGAVKQQLIRLHRFITGAQEDELVHHQDNNKLNNTDENLKHVDHSTNNHAKSKKKNATSNYHGVWYIKKGDKWGVEIAKDGHRYRLGTYKTEIEAAEAYNKKAIELYGDHAKLNVFDN